jgi:hypothetical protein
MADGAFRKIDVDQYDPDLVTSAELYEPFPLSPAEALAAAKDRERDVRGAITRSVFSSLHKGIESPYRVHRYRGDLAGALREALRDAPWGEGIDQAKVSSDTFSPSLLCFSIFKLTQTWYGWYGIGTSKLPSLPSFSSSHRLRLNRPLSCSRHCHLKSKTL